MAKLIKIITPDVYLESIYLIDIEKLQQKKNIKGIIVDLDNTLVPWGSNYLDKKIVSWIKQVKQSGMKICIVSNTTASHLTDMSNLLDIPFYSSRFKPMKRPFQKAMKLMNTINRETVVIGDQIFTDVLGGNRLKLLTILVCPLGQNESFGTAVVNRSLERFILSFWLKNGKIKLIKNKWPA
jgi:hypothetical protein